MPGIHQFVAGFSKGDAISNVARALRDRFRAWGYASRIYSDLPCIHPDTRGEARDARTFAAKADTEDVVLLQLSIGSPVNDLFAQLPCRKALLYQNITPDAFFRTLNPRMAGLLRRGREQMQRLHGAATVNLATSRYNASELESAGYPRVGVVPMPIAFEHLETPPDADTMAAMRDGRVNVLFVGRCAPNKRLDELLRVFAFYRHAVEPHARLVLAGSYQGMETYRRILLDQANRLCLTPGDVLFTGPVPLNVLVAYYRTAALFLCTSEHEGFCIPLLEAMFFDVPVLARSAGAVPETLGGAGVLFDHREYRAIAEMGGRLVNDPTLRAAVIRRQQERLAAYRARPVDAAFREALAPLLRGE